MQFRTFPFRLACCAVVLLGVTGCGSSPGTRFYSLSSMQPTPDASVLKGAESQGIITVGPVELADYLNRSQIVRRSGATRIDLLEFDHWAGSLQNELARVLVDNLQVHLSSAGYLVVPWEETATADGRIQVRVSRLEGTERNTVVLEALWMSFGKEQGVVQLAGEEFIEEQVSGRGVEAQVEAMSRAVAELSRRIGEQVKGKLNRPAINSN